MTTYTADDFAKAEFARQPEAGGVGMRKDAGDPNAWCVAYEDPGWRIGIRSDIEMARDGWVPVPAGSYTRTESPDYMDGGVASAQVEKEAEDAAHWLARAEQEEKRAEKAEKERDWYHRMYRDMLRRSERADLGIEQPRPLTADDISEQMVERARQAYNALYPSGAWSGGIRAALETVLIAPARPEGAERFDPIVDAAIRGHSDITSPDVVRAISDAIAEDLADPARPLTPDAIEVALHDCMPNVALDRLSGTQVMRLAEGMHAALTEPPARPEGAEEIEAELLAFEDTEQPHTLQARADYLAERGVRVTGAES